MTPSTTLIPIVQQHLYSSVDEMQNAGIQPRLRERILRIRETYTYWLRYPRTSDKDIVQMIMEQHHVATTQAYADINIIKYILGSLNVQTKDYDRYLFRQRCEEGWEMARAAGDIKSFASITAAYVKGTGLDKEDLSRPDYSAIVPQSFTITSDPSVAGFTVVPGILEKAKKLEKKYIQEAEVVPEFADANTSDL